MEKHLTCSNRIKRKLSSTWLRAKALCGLICSNNISIRLLFLIFKAVIRPALLYGSPLYRELYISTLVKIQQFENRLLWTIAMGTTLQRSRARFIRDTFNISTVKSYITQRHINFSTTCAIWIHLYSQSSEHRPELPGIGQE